MLTLISFLFRTQDLEFASIMVQNLNLIMITSPELSDFRKRLRTLDSKVRQGHICSAALELTSSRRRNRMARTSS